MKKQILFILAIVLSSLTNWHAAKTMVRPAFVNSITSKNLSLLHKLPNEIIMVRPKNGEFIYLQANNGKPLKTLKVTPTAHIFLNPKKDKMAIQLNGEPTALEDLSIINLEKLSSSEKQPIHYVIYSEIKKKFLSMYGNILWLPDGQRFIAITSDPGTVKINCFRCDDENNKLEIDHTGLPGITSNTFLTSLNRNWEIASKLKLFSPNAQYLVITKTGHRLTLMTSMVNTQTGQEIFSAPNNQLVKITFINNDSLCYAARKRNTIGEKIHLAIRELTISQREKKMIRKITCDTKYEDQYDLAIDVCPDRKFLAIVIANKIKILNLSSGMWMYQFAPHSEKISEITFYKKNGKLRLCSRDKDVAKIWQINNTLHQNRNNKKYIDTVIKTEKK